MRTMTKYTPEQRRDAVQMLKDFGAQKAQEALGIPPTTLYRWKKRLEEKKDDLVSSDTSNAFAADGTEDGSTANDSNDSVVDSVDEEQPRKPVTMPEIHEAIQKYFMDNLDNNPEIFVDSIVLAVKNTFKENEALRRENSKLRRTLQAMLEES